MRLEIFIPYWGHVGYMKEAVESVLAQDAADWSLTIVDDAYPTRDIENWIQELAHPNISYIRKEANEGITANYRTCVSLASEPLMMMLGCDDRLKPGFVSTVLRAHERFNNAAIIQPGVEVIDENGVVTRGLADRIKQQYFKSKGSGHQLLSGETIAASLLSGNWLYWPSLIFRTDVIRKFDFRDGFPIIQDLALVLDMIFAGEQMMLVPETVFQYRRHSASASGSSLMDGSRFAGDREYFKIAASLAHELNWRKAERAALLRYSSRLHAATLLPTALAAKDGRAIKQISKHMFDFKGVGA